MVHMDSQAILMGGDDRQALELLRIAVSDTAALTIERIDVTKLYPKNRRLHFIQSAVVANRIMVVAHFRAMISEHPHPGSHFIGRGHDQAAIAISPKVFAREKAVARTDADATRLPPPQAGTKGLCTVLDQEETPRFAECRKTMEVRGLPKQMDGHDGLGF